MPYELYQITSEEFPGTLAHIPDAPDQLYVRGTLPPKSHKLLTVVGSRAQSEYGKKALMHLFGGLRGQPISIVSGLALGTDALAHTLALQHGLHTIAVPGSGLGDDVIYPKTNRYLAHNILEAGGALLSEFPPDFKAELWAFPKRNRIVAGMSDAILMLEAAQKSGTLITARLASEYNKELLTIPHSLFSEHGAGPHQFLRLGATLVTEGKHICEALELTEEVGEVSMSLRPLEKKVYDLLEDPCELEHIVAALSLPRSDTLSVISALEIKGIITTQGGAYVRLRSIKT